MKGSEALQRIPPIGIANSGGGGSKSVTRVEIAMVRQKLGFRFQTSCEKLSLACFPKVSNIKCTCDIMFL